MERSRNIVRYASQLKRANGRRRSGGGRGELREQLLQTCVRCGHDVEADPRLRLRTQQSDAAVNPSTGIQTKNASGMIKEAEGNFMCICSARW